MLFSSAFSPQSYPWSFLNKKKGNGSEQRQVLMVEKNTKCVHHGHVSLQSNKKVQILGSIVDQVDTDSLLASNIESLPKMQPKTFLYITEAKVKPRKSLGARNVRRSTSQAHEQDLTLRGSWGLLEMGMSCWRREDGIPMAPAGQELIPQVHAKRGAAAELPAQSWDP